MRSGRDSRRHRVLNSIWFPAVATVDDDVEITSDGDREKVTANGLHWFDLVTTIGRTVVAAVNEAADAEHEKLVILPAGRMLNKERTIANQLCGCSTTSKVMSPDH